MLQTVTTALPIAPFQKGGNSYVLDELIEKIADHYGEQLFAIYLYGSRARGDFNDENVVALLRLKSETSANSAKFLFSLGDYDASASRSETVSKADADLLLIRMDSLLEALLALKKPL